MSEFLTIYLSQLRFRPTSLPAPKLRDPQPQGSAGQRCLTERTLPLTLLRSSQLATCLGSQLQKCLRGVRWLRFEIKWFGPGVWTTLPTSTHGISNRAIRKPKISYHKILAGTLKALLIGYLKPVSVVTVAILHRNGPRDLQCLPRRGYHRLLPQATLVRP
ncbi:hypothetical protein BX600DRAFT_264602 [Xylariales sp. PMI_506]|nr:hypothetical protein BX600DRAFT_264602 [Xylariales sp. PMI_506]